MKIPQELDYLAGCFYDTPEPEFADLRDWVRATVRHFLTPKQRATVKRFLVDALDGTVSDEDVHKLWRQLDINIWSKTVQGERLFLEMIRDAC